MVDTLESIRRHVYHSCAVVQPVVRLISSFNGKDQKLNHREI